MGEKKGNWRGGGGGVLGDMVVVTCGMEVETTNGIQVQYQHNAGPLRKHVIKYRPTNADLAWARQGMVAWVLNGESITLKQQRFMNAGFDDLMIIPLGADKVFLRSEKGGSSFDH